MHLKYCPSKEDYITLCLFITAAVPRVKKQMTAQLVIGKMLMSIFLVIGSFRYITGGSIGNIVLIIIGLLGILFYGRFNLWIYRWSKGKTYNRIQKNTNNMMVDLQIDTDKLTLADSNGEYKMDTAKLLAVYETKGYFYVQINKEIFLSIPKNQTPNVSEVKEELRQYAFNYNFPFIEKLEWTTNIYNKKSRI